MFPCFAPLILCEVHLEDFFFQQMWGFGIQMATHERTTPLLQRAVPRGEERDCAYLTLPRNTLASRGPL